MLCIMKFRYCIPKILTLVPVLSQMNPVHAFQSYSRFIIILLSMPTPSKQSFFFRFPHKKNLCISYVLHMCNMSGPSHPSWSDHLNNYLWAVNFLSPLVSWSLLRPKCSSACVTEHPQPVFFARVRDHVSGPYETTGKIYWVYLYSSGKPRISVPLEWR